MNYSEEIDIIRHPVFSRWIKRESKEVRKAVGEAIKAVTENGKKTPPNILWSLRGKDNKGIYEVKASARGKKYRVICSLEDNCVYLLSGGIKNDDNFYEEHAGYVAHHRLRRLKEEG